jgi:CTP synthase
LGNKGAVFKAPSPRGACLGKRPVIKAKASITKAIKAAIFIIAKLLSRLLRVFAPSRFMAVTPATMDTDRRGRENWGIKVRKKREAAMASLDMAKTKPTQHSVKELRSIGIQPDILVCRTEKELSPELKGKLALFCDVEEEAVIELQDAGSIYEVPLMLAREGLDKEVIKRLGLQCQEANLEEWEQLVEKIACQDKEVTIGLVGKYVELPDAYLSIAESLKHAGFQYNCDVKIEWIYAEQIEKDGAEKLLENIDAILVPGGFGERGIEGKISTARYARENKIPFLGICLGMQCAVIEFARNVCGLEGANSAEFDQETPYPVVHLMPDQEGVENKGGTMRLGTYPCQLAPESLVRKYYGQELIDERHRHRYEINNDYRDLLQKHGLKISGLSPDQKLVEIIELAQHPWFVACQFHPEFKSRPNRPHPLFAGLIENALAYRNTKK